MYYFPTGNTDQKLPNKDKPKNKTKVPKKVVAQKVMCLLNKKKQKKKIFCWQLNTNFKQLKLLLKN